MRLIKSGSFRIISSLVVLSFLVAAAAFASFPHQFSSAASNIVQAPAPQSDTVCTPVCSLTIPFSSPVTAGDVLVVLLIDDGSSPMLNDSLSSTFSQQGTATFTYLGSEYIYTATLSSSGSDKVEISDSSPILAQIYEVSGVTTQAAQTATGSTNCIYNTPCTVTTSSSLAFVPGAFMAGIFVCQPCSWSSFNAGPGFTAAALSSGDIEDESAYDSSGAANPTNFTATVVIQDLVGGEIIETGIVLEPVFSTTTTLTTTVTSTVTSTGSNIHTTTKLSCSPNPDKAGHTSVCTAKVTSAKGTAPVGSVRFYSSKGGTFSEVSCSKSSTTLTCSVSFTPLSSTSVRPMLA